MRVPRVRGDWGWRVQLGLCIMNAWFILEGSSLIHGVVTCLVSSSAVFEGAHVKIHTVDQRKVDNGCGFFEGE